MSHIEKGLGSEQVLCCVDSSRMQAAVLCAVPGAQYCLSLVVACTARRDHRLGQEESRGSQLVLERCGHFSACKFNKRKSPEYEEEKGSVCYRCTDMAGRQGAPRLCG